MAVTLTHGDYKCPLDDKTLKKAKKELQEDPKQRQSQINKLREWLEQQPHIKGCRKDDQFLLRFLRTSKFGQLRAQKMLDSFCKVRGSTTEGVPDWFQNIDLKEKTLSDVIDLGTVTPLGRDKEGRMVVLNRTGGWDPEDFNNVMKIGYMTMDILLRSEETQVHGFVIFLDFTEFGVKHVRCWGRDTISKAMRTWQDVYPTRNKGVNYYNTPTLFNALFEIFKYFMKEKQKNRLHFHWASKESLQKEIPKNILPEEFGGTAGPLADIQAKWKKELLESQDEFDLLNQIEIDDSKIPAEGAATSKSSDLGVQGSFRKLEI